uniref:Uncharacterized protein n=1 Tax=Rhizophora mucronata TaxID=61149 RepID=A0A2P2JYF1_RHIMU
MKIELTHSEKATGVTEPRV